MTESVRKKLKLIISIAVIVCFVWFVIVSPLISFRSNEKAILDAAKRYYELNPRELPTGERIGTVGLDTLYHKGFLEKDIYIPYTKKSCSISNSWVKVRRENEDYKYYVYLECGVLSSNIDHEGPVIKLNGEQDVVVDIGEEFNDPGVASVIDNNDGKLKVSDVIVKGKVDTNKLGSYKITYIAHDNLKNKSEVVRNVQVVQRLNKTVKKSLGEVDYYVGNPTNNYVYFSNMLFRIVGLDSNNNVKIIADKDIANVNFDGIDEWLKYYESNLTDSARNYIVNNKYCNMRLSDTTLDTSQCSSYTSAKKIGIISIDEINRSTTDEGNFLIPSTISWTANEKDSKNGYTVRDSFDENDTNFVSFEKKHNFGVRPVITIKGSMLINDGNGSLENPYKMEDYKKPKMKASLNERYVGEYIRYSGMLWRIISIEKDGCVKVASEESLTDFEIYHDSSIDDNTFYNTDQKGNVGYKINNKASAYFDTSYFVNHEYIVPIYNDEPQYGKEVETKKMKAKIISINMYEMFGATTDDPLITSYWFVNSSKSERENPGMGDTGHPLYDIESMHYSYGVRPVGYLKSSCVVSSGNGTKNNPFIIKK